MKARTEDNIESDVTNEVTFDKARKVSPKTKLELSGLDTIIDHPVFEGTNKVVEEHFLTKSHESVVNIFDRFKQTVIALGLSELK